MATNHEAGSSNLSGRATSLKNNTQTNRAMHPDKRQETRFHGWRLIGVILIVIVILAVVSFVVDWVVIGPLEGRAF
jgi:hypothetical protein